MKRDIVKAAESRVLLADGAMGVCLMERGLGPGECGELWNLERRRDVLEVHLAYREAGAEILITNTLGANRWKLERFGLAGSVGEINGAAAEVAREAAGEELFVLGDIAPTGAFMAPLGTEPPEAFESVFAEQAQALAAGGVDCIILETFTSLAELLAALAGASSTGLPVAASMCFSRDARGGFHTIMGDDVAGSVSGLEAAGADIIGVNCGMGPADYVDLAKEVRAAATRPVMVQPNAGLPRLVGGRTVWPLTPAEMAMHVEAILSAGVSIIGGCCGTTPEHIRRVCRVVDAMKA